VSDTEKLQFIIKYSMIFFIGGICYGLLEVVYRGHTHPSMVVAGGICFTVIVLLDNMLRDRVNILLLSLLGGVVITCVELVFGLIFNVWFKMGVWDYSSAPLNLYGQVCLPFSLLWVAVSLFAIIINRRVIQVALRL
jgi:uncharacterized membrane protein